MMKTAKQPAQTIPQLYSCDYLIRVNPKQLGEIVFEHLYTVQEAAVLADAGLDHCAQGGFTEWQGSYRSTAVSLSWDWIENGGGAIVLLPQVPPRTNIKLVDAKGYDIPQDEATPTLWGCIDALAWTQAVRDSLSPLGRIARH